MILGWQLWAATTALTIVAWLVCSWAFEAPAENVQVTWVCLGVVGACITLANLIDSWRDLHALNASGRNGDLLVVAQDGILGDGLRLIQMLTVIGVGVLSLWHGPVITDAQRAQLHIPTWTTVSIVITAGIGVIVLIAVLQAFRERRTRLTLYAHRGYQRRPDAGS